MSLRMVEITCLERQPWNKIAENDLTRVKCPNCGKITLRVPSQSHRKHCSVNCVIETRANVSDYIKKHIPWWFFGIENYDFVRCCICGGFYRSITNAHLKTHSISLEEYKNKYSTVTECLSLLMEKSEAGKRGGLPKGWQPSEEWIRQRKEIMYSDNPAYKPGVIQKISIKAKERYKNDEWIKSQIVVDRYLPIFGKSVESKKHSDMKKKYATVFRDKGHKSIFELPLKANGNWYVVDIYIKDLKLVVECGDCRNHKIADLSTKYNVIHAPYGREAYLVKRCEK